MEVVAETSPLFAWSGPFKAPANVSAPVDENDDVAVPPKNACVAEKSVDDAPPLKSMSDVVADWFAAGCVHASYAVRPVPVSVIGAAPITVKPEHVTEPAQVAEVVATDWSAPVPEP